jgi:hypothetical protein
LIKEKPFSKAARFALSSLLVVSALLLLNTGRQGYTAIRRVLDAGMPDGTFETLTRANASVFQVIFVGIGVLLTLVALALAVRPGWFTKLVEAVRGFKEDAHLLWGAFSLPKESHTDLLFLAAIEVVGLILRLDQMMAPMGYDESYTANEFARSLWTALTNYSLPNNHILHTMMVYFSTRIFGFEPWAVRLPAFIAGMLVPPALYWLSRMFYGRKTGLLAALLAAVASPLIHFSTDSRGYILISLLTIAALWLAAVLVGSRNRLGWFLFTLLIALGFYTVPVMMFPFGIIFLWLLAEGIWQSGPAYGGLRQFALYWMSSGICIALVTLVLYLPVLIFSGPDALFHNPFVTPLPWNDFWAMLPGRSLVVWEGWVQGIPVVLIALFLIGFILSLALHSRISRFHVPLQLAAIIWLSALMLIRRPDIWQRLFLFLIPLLIIWVSAGLIGALELAQNKVGSNYPWAQVGLAFLVALSLIRAGAVLPSIRGDWSSRRGPHENLVRWLQKQIRPDDLIVVNYPNDAPVRYYARLYGIDNSAFDTSGAFDRLLVILKPSINQTLDSVLSRNGLDPAKCEPSTGPYTSFGYMDVYVCGSP